MTNAQIRQPEPDEAELPAEVLDIPKQSVMAILDDPDGTDSLIDALGQIGLASEQVEVIVGPVAPQDDLRSRLLRIVQSHGEEKDMKDGLETELNDGHAIVVVHDVPDGEEDRICDALAAGGARDIHRYGQFSVSRLGP
jgi:hypothetical protein